MSLPTAITKLKNRNGYYTYYYDQNKRRRVYKKLADEKPLARRALRKLQEQLTLGITKNYTRLTLEAYYRNYYSKDYLILPQKNSSQSWAGKQRMHIEKYILPAFRNKAIDDITLYDAESFYKKLLTKVSRKYANHIAATFKRMLTRAEGRFISTTPVRNMRLLANPRHIPDTMTVKEVSLMYSKLQGRDQILFDLWVHTGLRKGEMQYLQWKDIDLTSGKLFVKAKPGHNIKDWEDRHIELKADLVNRLREYHPGKQLAYFFPNANGGIYSTLSAYVVNLFRRAGVRSGNCTLLRHTFASILLSSGCSLVELQHYMGHSSIAITEQYYAAFLPGERSMIHDADFGISVYDVGKPEDNFIIENSYMTYNRHTTDLQTTHLSNGNEGRYS